MTKHEITAIRPAGFYFLHTEGAEFAVKVTSIQYTPGKIYDPRESVKQELLIPTRGRWA